MLHYQAYALDASKVWVRQQPQVRRLPGLKRKYGLNPRSCLIAGEATAGIAILLGIHTRWFALAMIPVLLGATWAYTGNGWLFTNEGGGWEYPLLLSVLAGVQSLLGDGRYSVLNLRPSVGAMRPSA
ncbi:DoxX family protein [Marinimicrobium locisalis]|uniref:DoxX family protein n=1 Tax=Marinimicrobium locisalis TaxID=546022 RepID=UPI003D2F9DE4